MSAKIIINRKSQWMNRMRAFKIFVDDQEVGSVKNGNSEELVVEEGVHVVYLKFGFYRSAPLTLTLNKSENKFLIAQNGMKYFWPLYILMMLGIFSQMILKSRHLDPISWIPLLQIAMVIPGILYFLYYLVIARKKYLLLEIDHDNIFNS